MHALSRRTVFALGIGIFGLSFGSAPIARAATDPISPNVILEDLHRFRETASVLYVAAHPDDENTFLITYLARSRHYRTAYLSLTRGDGGQNVLSADFGEKLGVARTQELLAARQLDGGQQFFTRALDFGFSKDYRETLRIWGEQPVLSDVVRVIRTFRPDVVITRFSPLPSETHGHHTASAYLALEAFKLAGDPKAFPEQLAAPVAGERIADLKSQISNASAPSALTPWQPKRILWNGGGRDAGDALRIVADGDDPVTGLPFTQLAARSRAMHKTQGFGNFNAASSGTGPRTESFTLLAGEPAAKDIMDGIDTTWTRVPGGEEIGRLADDLIASFKPDDPAASVPALLTVRSRLAALQPEPLVLEKRALLDRVLQACLGLTVETTLRHPDVVPGEKMALVHRASVRAKVPVRWLAVRYPNSGDKVEKAIELRPGELAERKHTEVLPANTPLTQPYWLREEGTAGLFRVDDASLIGRPENPPAFPIEQVFEVGGQTLVVADAPVQIAVDEKKNESRRDLEVIPPVSLRFVSEVVLFARGATQSAEVELTAARDRADGTLQLEAPAGWKITPASQSFQLAHAGDHVRLAFSLSAPPPPASASIHVSAKVSGVRYRNDRIELKYAHIPPQLLQPVAQLKGVSLELAKRGQKIGYLPGAGDSVDAALVQMGYEVTTLTGADLTAEKLKAFDAVVIGVRAFNVRGDLTPGLNALFAYVEAGGTVVAQYNRPDGLKTDRIAPYDLHLSAKRITDETAPMKFLAPDHPALNSPNKITAADFDGWVQERGIYFPDRWDAHFTPLLAGNDAGESPLEGSLLVAPYGRGQFVYTGLVFFRELPAGVPGAYRLFANLVSLGKP